MLKSIKNKVLRVFHQNIRGLRNKTNELISSMHTNLPHITCLTEHRMKQLELEHFHIENYNLGARYCRKH
jgi:exonuclease III